jgi:hypothetical protein
MEHVRWHDRPTLDRPTLIAAFTGWNDAGDAASAAVRTLIETWGARPLATIDPEEYTDFATIRPHVRLAGGTTREIVWPTVAAWYASVPGGDVILLLGPEPSLRWRSFCEQVTGIASEYRVGLVVTLGALLGDVPHTRPVQLMGTSNDEGLIDRFDLRRSTYQGPTGIVGVLHDAFHSADIPSMSLWAAVPEYARQFPSPKASLALLEHVCSVVGTPVPEGRLEDDATAYELQLDALAEQDPDFHGSVLQCEAAYDEGRDDYLYEDDDGSAGGELDEATAALDEEDGEQLVEEVERFLRDQGGS